MYFPFDKEKIFRDYPVLSSEIDCIIHFFSLDLVKRCSFDHAFFSINESAFDNLFNQTFEDKIKKGTLLPYTKTSPFIIHIPCQQKYTDDFDKDYVEVGIDRLISVKDSVPFIKDVKKFGIVEENVDLAVFTEILNRKKSIEIEVFKK